MYRSFSDLLSRAIAGDSEAIQEILEVYRPLIYRYCRIDGKPDEDCRQYIVMRILAGIPKFVI